MLSNAEFRALYDAQYPLVLTFVRGAVNSERDVEEIVQDIFVRIARNYNFRGKSGLRTWILAIARNAIVDFWRKNKKQAYVTWSSPEEKLALAESHDGDPLGIAIKHSTAKEVRMCVDELPENMRLVLLCRVYQELSTAETADVLGWNHSKVRVTYSRALRKFRDMWRTRSEAI